LQTVWDKRNDLLTQCFYFRFSCLLLCLFVLFFSCSLFSSCESTCYFFSWRQNCLNICKQHTCLSVRWYKRLTLLKEFSVPYISSLCSPWEKEPYAWWICMLTIYILSFTFEEKAYRNWINYEDFEQQIECQKKDPCWSGIMFGMWWNIWE